MKGDPIEILLIEDNPAHTELLMRTFENHRFANKVYHVSDGEEALNYLFRRGAYSDPEKSPRPDLILLDLRLPKIDGFEVLKEMRSDRELAGLPVAVVTTSEAQEDVTQAENYGVKDYLLKPVEFSRFGRLLHSLGFYWVVWDQDPWPEEVT